MGKQLSKAAAAKLAASEAAAAAVAQAEAAAAAAVATVVKALPAQHGYVERIADTLLARYMANGGIIDVAKIAASHVDGTPSDVAKQLASDAATLATASGISTLAIPAPRLSADIAYTTLKRRSLSRDAAGVLHYAPRSLKSDASRIAGEHIATADAAVAAATAVAVKPAKRLRKR